MAQLAAMVRDSPYTAVLKHLRVKKRRKDESEEIHTYYARVVETLRGPKRRQIQYMMSVEPGEGAMVHQESVIVILCQDLDGLYWPGVGSIFPDTEANRAVAAEAARAAPADQTKFPNCD